VWHERAACKGLSEYFTKDSYSAEQAEWCKAVCLTCPVLNECYEENERLERSVAGEKGWKDPRSMACYVAGETPDERAERRGGGNKRKAAAERMRRLRAERAAA